MEEHVSQVQMQDEWERNIDFQRKQYDEIYKICKSMDHNKHNFCEK
jgi:hypothetical protein